MGEEIDRTDYLLDQYKHIIKRRAELAFIRELEFTNRKKKLSDCFNSHLYFGLHKLKKGWVFRELAPNATGVWLIGEFSDWKATEKFCLKRKDDGVWELEIPNDDLCHGTEYRLFITWNGGAGERLPSHARRVVQDNDTKQFSAQVWNPKEYKWLNESPKRVKNPLIYEAHIGMCTEHQRVSTFTEFRLYVLPRIIDLGYNTIQLMGIQEHPYYGSFGYQVSNFFAVSSRFGTPEELKKLIDEAHEHGISVVMDIVHSHSVKNEAEGLNHLDGSDNLYFHRGERGEHKLWDSLCFNYGKDEVLNFLLSNCKYWLEEFHLDGFRFDGVTSMIYLDHGLAKDFTDYKYYYDGNQDEDAITYLTLANKLIHQVNANAITIAEDVSGMPYLAFPTAKGGVGFDFRMSMGISDYWIKLIKEQPDEKWHVGNIFYELTNKRKEEHTISYAESHDQAMVGDKTIFFRLADKDIYNDMGVNSTNLNIERSVALHKMIRLVTLATAGDGYLNFMGNEFGHPEWIDFPREGNDSSYEYARRKWSLVDDKSLRYGALNTFDKEMIRLVGKERAFFKQPPIAVVRDIEKEVLIFKRGDWLFVFNFNPSHSYYDYQFEVEAGKYIPILNSDNERFNGLGRIEEQTEHFTQNEKGRNILSLYIPTRTALVYHKK